MEQIGESIVSACQPEPIKRGLMMESSCCHLYNKENEPVETSSHPKKELKLENKEVEDDPLIEIPTLTGTEVLRKSQIKDFDTMMVRCTICRSQINHLDYQKVKRHRQLKVIICKDCSDFYGKEEFTRDENGNYNYCTWCGNGGKLFLCDFCPNVYCSKCVRLNFGRAEVAIMEKDGWKCYMCDPAKLKTKVAYCDLILEYSKKISKKTKKNGPDILEDKQLISEAWVLEAFTKTENSCKSLQRKMEKLKSVEVSHSKSVKHIISKMKEVVNKHKAELRAIMENLETQYKSYKNLKEKDENLQNENISNGLSNKIDDSNLPPMVCLVSDSDTEVKNDEKHDVESENKVNNDLEKMDTDSLQVEKADSSIRNVIKENGTHVHMEEVKPDIKDKNVINPAMDVDKEEYAKVALLCDSSEDSDFEPGNKNCKTKTLNCKSNKKPHNITVTAEIHSSELQSDLESGKTPENRSHVLSKSVNKIVNHNTSRKNCAIKESSISSLSSESSDSLSEAESINSPRKAKGPRRRPQTGIRTKKKEIDYTNDEKLRLQTSVALERCDSFLEGKTTIPVPPIFLLDEVEKEIKSLEKEPKFNKQSKKSDEAKGVKKEKKVQKVVKKKTEKESSSSIHFSTSDESEESEDENDKLFKPISPSKENPEEVAKKKLLESDDEEDSDDSESELTSTSSDVKTKKQTKKKGATIDSDSADDFQPKKKKKLDKLLRTRLLSDDDESSGIKKNSGERKKKRKHLSSGDDLAKSKASHSETTTLSDSDEEEKPKSKRRKRIKKVANSSSDSGSGKAKAGKTETPKKGRKDINKIISKKDLKQETKEAQQAEKERKKRIEEKQKLYNVITDTSKDGKEIITKKLVLEIDPISKEEIVQIHSDLIEKLKPHQVNGVKFMWECTIESLKDLPKTPGSGCILAHCMGLGKTLQVITFLHTCLTNKEVNKVIKTAMVICPYNTVLNWSREVDMWLSELDTKPILLFEMTSAKDNYTRLDILKDWKRDGGILILSYDIFRRLAGTKIPKLKKNQKNQVVECLLDPGPDIVVCDEGHILKNEKSAISKACSLLKTQRRIVLTGTPLQNNLMEYHCMLSFVKPHLLGTSKEFRNRFVNPIINGQYEDSNEYDVRRMKKRIHILHKLLEGCVQRCDYSALTKFLPPKHEYVLSVKLSEVQIKMYQWYLDNMSKAKQQSKISGGFLFQDYNTLRNLCIHPYIIRTSTERAILKKEREHFLASESSTSESYHTGESGADTDEIVKKHQSKSRKDSDAESIEEIEKFEDKKEWYEQFFSEKDAHKVELSGKLILLMNILRECEEIGDKVILFTQSLLVLDLIEEILTEDTGDANIELSSSFQYSWTEGLDYFRMDGSTSADFRKHFIDMFNDPNNPRARLFLISTKAGGLGTNLVGANRVVILDASWNPSHDVQAIFRVYRFGQKKPVYIYRLLSQGTMEEKIYDRQVTKLSLSIRVVDEQQIDRHFNSSELSELYSFDPEGQSNRPTPMVPSDRLLAEMLIQYKDLIVSYHEHDSLLQCQTEEDLTEEERKAAWNEYENEREGRSIEDISIDEEIAMYCKEPDFDQADYEGSVLPNAKFIIDNMIYSLRKKYPLQNPIFLRKKLSFSMSALKMALNEKHVKVLRMKQEFFAKGSVPSTVNKYLDELNALITEITQHLIQLTKLVADDEANLKNYQAAQLRAAQAAAAAMQQSAAAAMQQSAAAAKQQSALRNPTMPNMRPPTMPTGLPPGFTVRFPFAASRAVGPYVNSPTFRDFLAKNPQFNVRIGRPPAPAASQPVITEAPSERQDVPNATTPSTSSVVIEEIE